jgi:hypothetical protein
VTERVKKAKRAEKNASQQYDDKAHLFPLLIAPD